MNVQSQQEFGTSMLIKQRLSSAFFAILDGMARVARSYEPGQEVQLS